MNQHTYIQGEVETLATAVEICLTHLFENETEETKKAVAQKLLSELDSMFKNLTPTADRPSYVLGANRSLAPIFEKTLEQGVEEYAKLQSRESRINL